MIKTRKNSIILSIVIEAIIILIAFLFWPNSTKVKQSNKPDRNKTQIQIKTKRLNIREKPSIDSMDIGDVYEGEIYNVISHEDKEDYNWYHIFTETGIDGYIASDLEDSYIEVINGHIDRTPPTIVYDKDFIEVVNDQFVFDAVTCQDDYSNCGLSYELKNPEYVTFKAVDDDGNIAVKDIKYYKVYKLYSEYYDNRKDINAFFSKEVKNNDYYINATYYVNKEIESDNKSITYAPFIEFYDENFNRIENVFASFNPRELSSGCMNDSNNILKDDYSNINLLKGNYLCMNYKFNNSSNKIKYIAFGFNGVENYNNSNNILSSYYSKYFIINAK